MIGKPVITARVSHNDSIAYKCCSVVSGIREQTSDLYISTLIDSTDVSENVLI